VRAGGPGFEPSVRADSEVDRGHRRHQWSYWKSSWRRRKITGEQGVMDAIGRRKNDQLSNQHIK